jgi:hypothetical protein
VIFTANFDEADTHGPAPTVILAAFLGHAEQWLRFNKKLTQLQADYGFKIFHAVDFKGPRGEFAGWSDQKRALLVSDLTDLVKDNLSQGLVVSLEHDRYMNEYRKPPIPAKMNLDSQYGACFRACLAHLIDFLAKPGNQDKLNVMEGGHDNVGDCRRIFDDLKRRYLRSGVDTFGRFTIELKETWPPLMAADLLAATYSMVKADKTINGPGLPPGALVPAENPEGALHFLELAPNALADLKDGFNRFRQLEIDEWRKRRDTRKAASSSKEQSS